jgi:hypothetical protein
MIPKWSTDMVYVKGTTLDVVEGGEPPGLTFARTSHNGWADSVRRGNIVMIAVRDHEERGRIRNKINRALRSRGIKASVRLAATPDGSEVYVVSLS